MAGNAGAEALTLLLLAISAIDSLSSPTQSTSDEVRKMVSSNGKGQSSLPGHSTTAITRENLRLNDNRQRDPVDVDYRKLLRLQTNKAKAITVQPNTIRPDDTDLTLVELLDKEVEAPRVLQQSATTVTVSIRLDPGGPWFYSLVVAGEPRNDTTDNLPTWSIVQALDLWPPYKVPVRHYGQDSWSVEKFIIGEDNCDEGSRGYCNGPLNPDTKYYVKLRRTHLYDFTDSAYTVVYTADTDLGLVELLDKGEETGVGRRIDVEAPRVLQHSTTTVTVSIRLDPGGPWFYSLVVAGELRNDISDDLPTWSIVHVLEVWRPYKVPVRHYGQDSWSVEKFIIGEDNCDEGSRGYCNGPLKPDTKYYVKLRRTNLYDFTDSAYTEVYTDVPDLALVELLDKGEETGAPADGNTKYALISITIISVTALILLVVFAVRKRSWFKCNKPSTPRLLTCKVKNPFYLNLLFRKECAKEIAEIEGMKYDEVEGHEHIYEEIDYANIILKESSENIIVPAVTD